MNIPSLIAQWLQTNGYATVGTDLFIDQLPNEAPDETFWLINGGGSVQSFNATKERTDSYTLTLFYRNKSPKDVIETLEEISNDWNTTRHIDLDPLDVRWSTSSLPDDQGRDANGRAQGTLTLNLIIYRR